ncbi:putative gamma 3 hordein [Schistosoma mansoni]|uniref:putative gamma 3 hordein n=1 Tax=Schistosoma mansoni TaxID=6183 RepID=UPI00022DCB91|nr:putative gamma 3 hordein [Schistosoma mansoni]|eukprot:XP_018655475.1 putative gamma 3 hordein [Schistosoma mansoni]
MSFVYLFPFEIVALDMNLMAMKIFILFIHLVIQHYSLDYCNSSSVQLIVEIRLKLSQTFNK